MSKRFSIRPTLTMKGRRFMGIRGFTGHPSHPPLTDFPIVCYVVAAGCDVVSFLASNPAVRHDFFMAGTIVMVAGFAVSLLAVLTGFMDWARGLPRDRKTGPIGKAKRTQVWRTANWHMTVMLTVTVFVIADLLLRFAKLGDGQAPALVVALSVLAALGVMFGATYGGALVFDYGFNVETPDGPWKEQEQDEFPGRRTSS